MELNMAAIIDAIALAQPQREALVFRDRSFSWAELADRTSRLAGVLVAHGLGMRRGVVDSQRWESAHDHVAIYLHNSNEYLETMIGAWKARCAPFNVNYRYVADELAYLLEDSSAAAVVVQDCYAATLSEVLPKLTNPPVLILQVADETTPLTGRKLLPGAIDYAEALAAASGVLADSLRASWSGDDIYLCYTGGTTGMPKGTMWRQGDFLVAALGVRRSDGSDWGSIGDLVTAARGTVRALPAPPLMHGAAHWNALSAWSAGGTVVIQDHPAHFDPRDVLDAAERHDATSLLVVGDPMARPLVEQLREYPRPLPHLRHIVSGGAVLSAHTKAALAEVLPTVAIVDVLGSTESGRQGVAHTRPGSTAAAGFTPGDTSVVLDEQRQRLLEAVPGEGSAIGWLAQSGRVPLGYLGDPAKTAQTFPEIDGVRYAVPGDRARWDDAGGIELLGRDSVCINTGGEKVFAEEVETALKIHPSVHDAVVCGRSSPRWGEEVVAVVSFRDGPRPTLEDLRSFLGDHLARYKLPKEVIEVSEVVRAPSGKADYRWARSITEAAVSP